jgi:hypothetical protein
VVQLINPILRGWVNYFAVGHSSRCFSFIKDWVDKKIRRHMLRATAKAVEHPPAPKVGAPVLDPTDERDVETELRRGYSVTPAPRHRS